MRAFWREGVAQVQRRRGALGDIRTRRAGTISEAPPRTSTGSHARLGTVALVTMPLPTPPTEAASIELLQELRDGNDGAFEQLYRRHRDELLLAVRSGMGARLRAAMQSEDVLQSVAMEAFRVLRDDSRPPPQGFLPLLRHMVRHRLIDRARALGRQKRAGETALSDTLAAGLGAEVQPSYSDPRYEHLERALQKLPPDMREVIRWRRFDGLPSADIAMRTGRTDAAVRKLLSRAMARLTLLMQEES